MNVNKNEDSINEEEITSFTAELIGGTSDPRTLSTLLHNTLTGKDNKTHDIIRVSLFLTILVVLGLQIYVTVTTGVFSVIQFCTGVGGLLFGSGHALKAKASTEPDVDVSQPIS